MIKSLEDGSADTNRDDRISVWEAVQQAAVLTDAWYADNKLLASEDAILDDNGDGKGTRLVVDPAAKKLRSPDGGLAKRTYLKDLQYPEHIPEEWIIEYREAIARVEEWIAGKAAVDSVIYVERLEALLVEAAKANRRIRENVNKEDVEM